MTNPVPRGWQSWRVAPVARPADAVARVAGNRVVALCPEQPGPDGIRWGLVARVRAEIAAGVYDTDDRWAAAEERLLRRIEGTA